MSVDVLSAREFLVNDDSEDLREAQQWFKVASQLEGRGHRMRVAFTVHATQVKGGTPPSGPGKPGAVGVFRDRGQRPALVWAAIAGEGGFEEALRSLANQRNGVSLGGDLTRVEMHVWEEAK